jgi:iron complex transport system permease protein
LIFITSAVFLISLAIGRFSIEVKDIIRVMLGQTSSNSKNIQAILLNVRIPRTIGALLVGMALACSGAAYQSTFQNPMASPNILGAASGAACGASIGILLNFSDLAVQLISFIFGILAVFLTYTISKIVGKGRSTIILLLLIGIVISALFAAIISITKYFADVDNQLPAITFWLMGGLTNVKLKDLKLVVPIILLGVAILNYIRWDLNIMSFGDDEGMAMGIDVNVKRIIIIALSTFVSSAAISISGLVGWVGIIIPHSARMISGSNYKDMLPIATLMGGIYLMVIDDIARNAFAVEIPLGILTAIIGAPFFIYLLFKCNYFEN